MPRALSARRSAQVLVRLAVAGGIAAVAATGFVTYRIWEQGTHDDRRPADAIVVMGAAQYDGRPSPVFAARIDHAIELFHEGIAPWLIVTGGKQQGDRTTEAATALAYATARGVPAEAILVEDESRTTLRSIRGVASLMDRQGLSSAVFVSDPSHMLRVLRMASDAGVTAYGSPTTTSPVERDLSARVDAIVHELGALAVYVVGRETP